MRWLPLCSIVLLFGCDADKIARLEKENKELKAKLDEKSKLVDLDTQSKCSTAAKAFFRQNWQRDKDTILLDYTNHYNQSLGKCFILVEWHSNTVTDRGEWFNTIELYDVFENNKYASVTDLTTIDQKTFESSKKTINCEADGEKCKTLPEFYEKTRGYMSN